MPDTDRYHTLGVLQNFDVPVLAQIPPNKQLLEGKKNPTKSVMKVNLGASHSKSSKMMQTKTPCIYFFFNARANTHTHTDAEEQV